jgi:hypothetical protein
MDTAGIINQIDEQISRLQQAKSLLAVNAIERRVGRPKTSQIANPVTAPKKRVMSAEGKAKIAEAQRARWAKSRRADKKAAKAANVVKTLAKKVTAKKSAKAVESTKPVKTIKAIKADKPELKS